jgi:hypothetical protein
VENKGEGLLWCSAGGFFLLALFVLACGGGGVDEGENFGNLLDSPAGLVLTEEEHPDGWGRTDCTLCHHLDNIHLVNRTGLSIDIQATHDQAIAAGIGGCAACHGTNGNP